jgi:hypothetical protein
MELRIEEATYNGEDCHVIFSGENMGKCFFNIDEAKEHIREMEKAYDKYLYFKEKLENSEYNISSFASDGVMINNGGLYISVSQRGIRTFPLSLVDLEKEVDKITSETRNIIDEMAKYADISSEHIKIFIDEVII